MNNSSPDKSPQKIRSMFDEIAPTYDRLNHLFTLNLDKKWRKEIIEFLGMEKVRTGKVLDLASGTGDLAVQLLKLEPEEIVAVDISEKMLEIQKEKISDPRLKLIRADASELPFADDYFDVITIGFGIRNFDDLSKSLTEISRVLSPDGVAVIIEMFNENNFINSLFNVYFGKIMPYVGNRISRSKYAYRYLFESVRNFYTVNEFVLMSRERGLEAYRTKNNFLGIVNTVYLKKL